jgi:peptidoglycan L-alanyl-D-glutamate endopeptidase CwlK
VIDKLAGVHPALINRVRLILDAMATLGHPMLVTDGVRTQAQQQALYAKGRTAPGSKVTNVDGVRVKSNHQPKADGFGHAVDCCFFDERGKPSWAESHPWRLYGEMAKALGLVWGGDWKSIVDKPHVELPKGGQI